MRRVSGLVRPHEQTFQRRHEHEQEILPTADLTDKQGVAGVRVFAP